MMVLSAVIFACSFANACYAWGDATDPDAKRGWFTAAFYAAILTGLAIGRAVESVSP